MSKPSKSSVHLEKTLEKLSEDSKTFEVTPELRTTKNCSRNREISEFY